MIVQPRLSCVCGDVLNSIRITLCCGTFPPRKVYTLQKSSGNKRADLQTLLPNWQHFGPGAIPFGCCRTRARIFFSMKFKRDEKNAKIRR